MHGRTTQGARKGKGRSLKAGSKQVSKRSGTLHTALDLLFSCRTWSGERGSRLVQGQCLGRSRRLRVKGRATRELEVLGIGVVSCRGLRVGGWVTQGLGALGTGSSVKAVEGRELGDMRT